MRDILGSIFGRGREDNESDGPEGIRLEDILGAIFDGNDERREFEEFRQRRKFAEIGLVPGPAIKSAVVFDIAFRRDVTDEQRKILKEKQTALTEKFKDDLFALAKEAFGEDNVVFAPEIDKLFGAKRAEERAKFEEMLGDVDAASARRAAEGCQCPGCRARRERDAAADGEQTGEKPPVANTDQQRRETEPPFINE